MSKVVIFGEGKIADVVYFHLTNDSPHEIVAFTADRDYISKDKLFGLPVIPFEEIKSKFPPDEYKMFIALGYQNLNSLRATKYFEAKNKGYELISYISSKATNFGNVEIGDNCLILENNAIQPMSKIGNNVTLWSGNHIGHHSTIGDHCYISGQVVIGGSTTIGQYCFIGINATIGHEITIGEKNLIGAEALITKNTEPNSVFISLDTPKYRLDSSSFLKLTRL
jgi:sugar O-acyltransferase (sialic acid O-acetyltransferase NeuD family)